jgi:hypothetical protein
MRQKQGTADSNLFEVVQLNLNHQGIRQPRTELKLKREKESSFIFYTNL